MRRFVAFGRLLVVVLVSAASACSSSRGDNCEAWSNCTPDASVADGAADTDSPVGDGQPPSDGGTDAVTCDSSKSPKDEPCLIDDAYGVFVAPSGSDAAGEGTKAKPYATISKALASASTKIVFACASVSAYAEHVTIANGVRLYGGLACPGGDAGSAWTYSGTKSVVAPATGVALTIKGASSSVTIEDFEFDAADGPNAGDSSIAAFISSSPDVTLRRVKLKAGAGKKGADGVTASNHFASSLDGNTAASVAGGASKTCACLDGVTSSQGGAGGAGSPAISAPTAGKPGAAAGAAGKNAAQCNAEGGGGSDGADGLASTADGAGASKLGTLSASGWTPTAGAKGSNGAPGQGGGGGGNGKNQVGGGGGGACGGCGGGGGTGGGGGGSSFALLVFESGVTLQSCALVAGDAGGGGKGGDGEGGQAGGATGNAFNPGGSGNAGCPGGNGGTSAGGNGAGGGAGGASLGIGYVGTAPSLDSSTQLTVGTAGGGGTGGAAGAAAPLSSGHAGAPGTSGIAGVAQTTALAL